MIPILSFIVFSFAVFLHWGMFGKNVFNSVRDRSSCGNDVNTSSAGDCMSVAVGDCQLEIETASGMAAFPALSSP